MHMSPCSNIVLVLSAPPGVDVASAGCAISDLSGVTSVTVYPERGQLQVRYEPSEIAPSEIRACLYPHSDALALPAPLLAAWPRVAEVLPIAVGFL